MSSKISCGLSGLIAYDKKWMEMIEMNYWYSRIFHCIRHNLTTSANKKLPNNSLYWRFSDEEENPIEAPYEEGECFEQFQAFFQRIHFQSHHLKINWKNWAVFVGKIGNRHITYRYHWAQIGRLNTFNLKLCLCIEPPLPWRIDVGETGKPFQFLFVLLFSQWLELWWICKKKCRKNCRICSEICTNKWRNMLDFVENDQNVLDQKNAEISKYWQKKTLGNSATEDLNNTRSVRMSF